MLDFHVDVIMPFASTLKHLPQNMLIVLIKIYKNVK